MAKKISIITACFNSESTIKDCLQSINCQSYPVEHIVIDGASYDNTVNLVRELSPTSIIVSEQDSGLYDAMNKGICLASGDIIGLLNSDDFYAHGNIIEMIARQFENYEIDACYSDLVYVDQHNINKVARYWKSNSFKQGLFEKGWAPPHPTFFVRRNVYERFGSFDLSYKIAADFDLMTRFMVNHNIMTMYIPHVTVCMRLGGTTNNSITNIVKQNVEIFNAIKNNNLTISPLFVVYKLLNRFSQYLNKRTL